jgi:signal transduction histidine kinase
MASSPGDPAATERADGALRRGLLLDLGPVVVLALLTFTVDEADRPRTTEAVLLLVVLPLLIRRRWPLPSLVAVGFGAGVTSLLTPMPWVQVASVALAGFTLGDRAADRTIGAFALVAVAAAMSLGFIAQDADPIAAAALPFVFLVPSWLLGDVVRAGRVEAARRAESSARSLRHREERLRAAAADERRHVARELHDVVAHAVSVMVVQAGAARQVIRTSPAQAEESMLAVETTGREAMNELRRFLGTLTDDDEAAGLAPQPGIAEISALLERVREAGLPASLEVDGVPRSIPASLEVAVYRIVQEALTNALRYARRAATLVRLSWEREQLRVEILDDGPTAAAAEGTGRGLVGMRERATLVGGRLEAGPRVGGGYAVRAWLPLDPGPTAEAEPS